MVRKKIGKKKIRDKELETVVEEAEDYKPTIGRVVSNEKRDYVDSTDTDPVDKLPDAGNDSNKSDYEENYVSDRIDDKKDIANTDIDKIVRNVFKKKKRKEIPSEEAEQEEDSFGGEHDRDEGGVYKRNGGSVIDENTDNPPAGKPGHPGIDEDTS